MNGSDLSPSLALGAAVRRSPAKDPLWLLLRINLLQSGRKLLALREQSKLLSALILCFLTGYVTISFALFYRGLQFANQFPGLGEVLVERMMFLLFASLFALLLLSNLVIAYTNLFRNRETAFLLTLPVSTQTIFRWKFIESTLLASWAFLFLVAPLLAAYGLVRDVPWHFYPLTILLLALFLILPAAAGGWLAVTVARFLDRRAFQLGALLVGGLVIVALAFWLRPAQISDEELEMRVLVVLDRLLARTNFAQFPLLPSYWVAAGVQQWAEGALASALFFALVLLSYALLLGSLMFTRTGGYFYRAASAAQSRGSVLGQWGWWRAWQRRRASGLPGRGVAEVLFRRIPGVRPDVRALLLKDMRVFWRDTTQWAQTLVIFGLITVYILNLRHFSAQLSNPFWIQVVSFLNLAACTLNLATLTTRFVFPQFSLEGKRVWIVGLAPLGLRRLLTAKFLLASTLSLAITGGLLLLSCHMLSLEWPRTAYLAVAVTVMCFALNGLAVGMGALYPNFKEDNPSKIVSGFGGTFCLVVSFIYIVAGVGLVAVGSPWPRLGEPNWLWIAACWAVFVGVSLLVGWLPMRLGLRKAVAYEL